MKHAASLIFRSIILILAGVTIGLLLNNQGFVARQVSGNRKVDSALMIIKQRYVDTVNIDTIETNAINGMLQQLDPHSVFLAKQQARSVNERLEGSFNGLGLEYILLRDTMVVTMVYPNSPAAKAGMTNGDHILSINKRQVAGTGITTDTVSKLLEGPFGTRITIAVKHLQNGGQATYNLTRGPVPLTSLDAAYQLDAQTGYVKFSKFASTTDTDFRKAFSTFKKAGVNKLVIDLRGNRGGYLNAATALSNEFLPKGKLIVYTKGAHEPRQDYTASGDGVFEQGKLAVLIDEYSASASEIFAGAMQDLDRGVIIGRRSFGKGLVQQQFPFEDGSAINLTVARYYTPSGRSIQKSYQKGVDEYRDEINQREQKGELTSAAKNYNDPSLKKSNYHTEAGKKVYAGGGIMPDVFVPEDTTFNSQLIGQLKAQRVFSAYTIDRLLPIINQYQSLDEFVQDYTVSDRQLHDFMVYATSFVKNMDTAQANRSANNIRLYLKAYAARFKWGDAAYFRSLYYRDQCIAEAVRVLK
ncbi:S41 family peptidase [Mucilaginibacter sp. RS28]|uniref:S41 family peptidase n=1 Tax=Mucilaginibacter straminoryzae TaxID=2932774 RepID=A0A9X2BEZ1_9SPHI|nr:S41 family peptidase [Mucilaginibacter straminoryzae]MCJ8211938.1 S41 family peptidase [Mucilaginibacter straminoryzae]